MKSRPRLSSLLGLMWPLLCAAVVQTVLILASLEALSAVRIYLTGENHWSKGFKDAAISLPAYVETHDEKFNRQFQEGLAKPLGDLQARLEMEKPEFDYKVAYTGYAAGGMHPEDISLAIKSFRLVRDLDYMKPLFGYWRATDKGVIEFQALGNRISTAIKDGLVSRQQHDAWRAEIRALHDEYSPISMAFSEELNAQARLATKLLFIVNFGVGVLLIGLGVFGTRKLMLQRVKAEAALAHEQQRAHTTLASIGDAVVTVDAAGQVDYMNAAAEKLVGREVAESEGQSFAALFRLFDEQTQTEMLEFAEVLRGKETGETFAGTRELERADGSRVAVSITSTPLPFDDSVSGAVVVLRDMTKERQYVAKLSWQASHDALTNIFNRREFDRRLASLIDRVNDLGGHHALLYVDLDQFKIVNDTGGHAVGDRLLCQTTSLLQQGLREGDTLARLGGDEFGILLENCAPEHALKIAEKLRQAVEDLCFIDGEHAYSIGASVGVVCLSQSLFNLQEALRAADMACYMAKERGRNRVHVYDVDDSELAKRAGQMSWVTQLRQALSENRFCLYAQEIASLNAQPGEGLHVEILLRLRDKSGRLVLPGEFLPAAERYGLMPQIDRWVVQNTFVLLAGRQRAGASPIATCAINLSGATIGDESFLDFLGQQFATFDIDPKTICFEVTETVAVSDIDSATRFIQALQALGCRFALDDFGSGMSSFGYLKNMPIDLIKIDGSFVKDMLGDPFDFAVVEMVSRLAHTIDKQSVAEFVENQDILDALGKLKVDFAQGYAIAKPQPFVLESAEAQATAENSNS